MTVERLGVLMNLSGLASTSFDNGINLVGAIEFLKRTPLAQVERPREYLMDAGSSASSNRGTFRQVNGTTPDPTGGLHGGTHSGAFLMDPSCGTFNPFGPDLTTQERVQSHSTPGGVPPNLGTEREPCRYNYTKGYHYRSGLESVNTYANASWVVTDRLQLEPTGTYFLLDTGFQGGSVSTVKNPNNRQALVVPADHPANPRDMAEREQQNEGGQSVASAD